MTTNITISPNAAEKSGLSTFRLFHAIGQTTSWSLLVFIGYVSARFFKHKKSWIYLHFIGGVVPSLYTIWFSIGDFLRRKIYFF